MPAEGKRFQLSRDACCKIFNILNRRF